MLYGFQSKVANVMTTDGRNFTLVNPITYIAQDGSVYIMPMGATSDGASTPAEMWPAIPPFGSYWLAAFLHDCAYRDTLQLPDGTAAALPKARCDDLLREAMLTLSVSVELADTIYEGVVYGGWSSFDSDRAGG
jgi:hypothetical protein